MPTLTHRAGDRVRLVYSDWLDLAATPGTLGTVERIDREDEEFPYHVHWDGVTYSDWMRADEIEEEEIVRPKVKRMKRGERKALVDAIKGLKA
jgi:hypothetical protein